MPVLFSGKLIVQAVADRNAPATPRGLYPQVPVLFVIRHADHPAGSPRIHLSLAVPGPLPAFRERAAFWRGAARTALFLLLHHNRERAKHPWRIEEQDLDWAGEGPSRYPTFTPPALNKSAQSAQDGGV